MPRTIQMFFYEKVEHDICSFSKEFGKGDSECGSGAQYVVNGPHEECSRWGTPEEYTCDICTKIILK